MGARLRGAGQAGSRRTTRPKDLEIFVLEGEDRQPASLGTAGFLELEERGSGDEPVVADAAQQRGDPVSSSHHSG